MAEHLSQEREVTLGKKIEGFGGERKKMKYTMKRYKGDKRGTVGELEKEKDQEMWGGGKLENGKKKEIIKCERDWQKVKNRTGFRYILKNGERKCTRLYEYKT